ncbi:MAG: hypothetical protein H6990_01315 [Pseudomonadales bacterium]|nr:hypothetical protein [Pseudomonadales bacterium]
MWQLAHCAPAEIRRVVVVLGGIVFLRHMALGADPVAQGPQRQAVGFVAIAADHAGKVHFALQEGAVYVVLVAYLAIVVVQRGLGQRQPMGGEQIGAVVIVPEGAAARVTATATVYLGA